MDKKSKSRPSASEVLLDFLKEKKMDFLIRKQTIRYLEDNAILIESPVVIPFYIDEVKGKVKTPTRGSSIKSNSLYSNKTISGDGL